MTDQEILAKADPKLCHNPQLQVAHDRMLLNRSRCESVEYSRDWQAYLKAGGDRTMRDNGIDLDNWHRFM